MVVGTSIGGAAALDFALTHPEDVAALVLIDAQGFIDGAAALPPNPPPARNRPAEAIGARPLAVGRPTCCQVPGWWCSR